MYIFLKNEAIIFPKSNQFFKCDPPPKKKKTHKSNIKVSVLKIYSFLKTYCISLLLNFINKK